MNQIPAQWEQMKQLSLNVDTMMNVCLSDLHMKYDVVFVVFIRLKFIYYSLVLSGNVCFVCSSCIFWFETPRETVLNEGMFVNIIACIFCNIFWINKQTTNKTTLAHIETRVNCRIKVDLNWKDEYWLSLKRVYFYIVSVLDL